MIPSNTHTAAVNEHRAIELHSGSWGFNDSVGPWHAKQSDSNERKLSGEGNEELVGVCGLDMTATTSSDVIVDGIEFVFKLFDSSKRTGPASAVVATVANKHA